MASMPHGWCSRPECPCWRRGKKACSEWLGYWKPSKRKYRRRDVDTWPYRYCPCCGMEKSDHKPLFHKGRKP